MTVLLTVWLIQFFFLHFYAEKKSSHSTSKSSKSKKNKHKAKGKTETTEVHTESWREEIEPKPDSNGARTAHSQHNSRVISQETEVSSHLEANGPQSNLNAATSEKGEIVKSQQDETERKANVEENEEKNVKENGDEVTRAAELKGEEPEIEGMNPPEINSPEMTMTEQRKAGMVFQQEPVVPLRSRGKLVSFILSKLRTLILFTDIIHGSSFSRRRS